MARPMITVTMWHDPDCPKSAKALAALKEFPVEVLLRPILQQPPTVEELRGALAMLQATPQALLRKREPMAKELGLDHAPDDELLEALVTYPSLWEGFGNALLEAIYFKKPVLVNRYAIFARDIEPKGFRIPTMSGVVTRKEVEEVRLLLEDEDHRRRTVDHNYELANRFFSYQVAQRKLGSLIANIAGDQPLD